MPDPATHSTDALIAALLRLAEIAGPSDRAVFKEAAERLGELAEDGKRLDFVEAERVKLAHEGANGWWYASGPGLPVFCIRDTARDAIDAARDAKAKEDSDG